MLVYEHHLNHLSTIKRAAMDAADPYASVYQKLSVQGDFLHVADETWHLTTLSSLYLVALGKASPTMCHAAADALGDYLVAGVAAIPLGYDKPLPSFIHTFPAGHPLPDEGSLAAGRAAAELLASTLASDLVLVLISGGGSAMFEHPLERIDLEDLRTLNTLLLHSGAPIEDVNTVRRALSQTKSGGLARMAAPAPVVSLILSDVVGDQLTAIASGPTVLRRVPPEAARAVLDRYAIWDDTPQNIQLALTRREAPRIRAQRPKNILIGSNSQVVSAAAGAATDLGFQTTILTHHMRGEAREIGRRMARKLRRTDGPSCLLMGGETTVTVRGNGVGGRNQELALSTALELEGVPHWALMSLATDGVDGPTDAAGAIVSGDTILHARSRHMRPEKALEENDAYPLLNAIGALLQPGPSGTNLNDLVVGLKYSS